MKNRILLIAVLALMSLQPAFAQMKIGYANLELILAYMPETKAVGQELKTMEAQLSQKVKVKSDYFQTRYQEAVEEAQSKGLQELDPEVAQELQKLQSEARSEAEKADRALGVKQQELMAPILEKLQGTIKEYAEANGYTYILNSAAGGTSIVLKGPNTREVTKDILTKLGVSIPESN